MAEKVKEYDSEELTVIWKPGMCIHSEKCWKGLSTVFNPNERPWVNVKGATDQEIKSQINQCPSGALSYRLKGEQNHPDDSGGKANRVEVAKNGPLMVHGDIRIKHQDGSESERQKMTAFCRCGASENKPFCDGSHKKIDFTG
ncbi:MAG: hypothetical protein Tsb0034_20600 [Ekhidna sp.]